MRIVSSNELPEGKSPERLNVQTPAAGAIASNAVGPQSPAPSRFATDTTQISSLGSKLSSIPEIRQDRVAQVSAQLKSGGYQVSDQQIADSMLRDFRISAGVQKS
jgi:flagellar biosynthesis anti-sigma factor FlgM